MSITNTGGPAFPRCVRRLDNKGVQYTDHVGGMSLRTYVAVEAMKAFITSHPHTAEHTPALVDDAYRMADAFIQQGEPSSNGNENAVNLKLAAALKEAQLTVAKINAEVKRINTLVDHNAWYHACRNVLDPETFESVRMERERIRTGLKRMSVYLRMKKLVDNGIAEVINKDAYASNNNTPYLYRLRATTSTLRNKG